MKILGSLIATAALTGAGLVAIPAAEAAPYPGTVATECALVVPGAVKRNKTITMKVRARTTGNARVSGKVQIRVYKIKSGRDRQIRQKTKAYSGRGFHKIGIRGIKTPGRYKARAWFLPADSNSVFQRSYSKFKYFRVKR
jgi:hypothetical protein